MEKKVVLIVIQCIAVRIFKIIPAFLKKMAYQGIIKIIIIFVIMKKIKKILNT